VDETFQLLVPSPVSVGGGVSESLGEHARRLGLTRVLVVTDEYLLESGPVGGLVEVLEGAGVSASVYSGTRPDPTVANVDAAMEQLHEHGGEGVVVVGGGSPIDAGKAVAIMARNPGGIAEYAGYDRFEAPGLPLIAVPTTAGSGSEVTRATVIADEEHDVKLAIYDDKLMPTVALVDYRLTLSMPRELTAHVGLDSLVHAIEAYVSRLATPLSDMLALEAVRQISANLRRAFHDPSDEAARAAMMLGATLAGAAFSNASLGLVHGMSRPIGAHFHIPHGLSNALVFPAVTRFSLDAARGRYADVARAMGVARGDASDEVAAAELVEELERLNEELEIPSLRELEVDADAFEAALAPMADAAIASRSPEFNPRQPSAEEIVALYRQAF
jgi:alcohol dehydrogenase class IV